MAVKLSDMAEKKKPTETVRVAADLVRRINRIASHLDKSVPDYLNEILGPIVDRHEAKMLDDIARERKQQGG